MLPKHLGDLRLVVVYRRIIWADSLAGLVNMAARLPLTPSLQG